LERPFAHLFETGGFNLGLLMRTLCGVGTPRSLQGRAAALLAILWRLIRLPETFWGEIWTTYRRSRSLGDLLAHREGRPLISLAETVSPRAARVAASPTVQASSGRSG
jgi:hypothetical protein